MPNRLLVLSLMLAHNTHIHTHYINYSYAYHLYILLYMCIYYVCINKYVIVRSSCGNSPKDFSHSCKYYICYMYTHTYTQRPPC